jgi:hypothetical protein
MGAIVVLGVALTWDVAELVEIMAWLGASVGEVNTAS